MTDKVILVGDLGGTKTNLALISTASGIRRPLVEAAFASGDYPGLSEIINEFLAASPYAPRLAVLGVAGPVQAGRARITNLPWHLEEKELAAGCGLAAVNLINDLAATAWAVPELLPEDQLLINDRKPEPGGAIAVIAPGTGLGEAFLVWEEAAGSYRAHPSEGGHADFAPVGDEQMGLLNFLSRRLPHVSYEHLCSGMGLPLIYAYYKECGLAAEPLWIARELAAGADATPLIIRAALDPERHCPLCRAALECFVAILAAEAANLALKVLAFGGVYLAGGIGPRISDLLIDGRFMEAFTRKGRMAELVAAMPMRLITNPKAALLGAAAHGLRLADESG